VQAGDAAAYGNLNVKGSEPAGMVYGEERCYRFGI
jgi:hypothetical protein